VLKAGINRPPTTISGEIVAQVREQMGAVVALKTAIVVPRLPKTRSGKILRGTILRIANGEEYALPATIEDPGALTDVEQALSEGGVIRAKAG
jgi:propionyl-CoA synthetase